MLKTLLVCALLLGSSLFVWWFRSGESPFDNLDGVVDADEKIETKEEPKAESPIQKRVHVEENSSAKQEASSTVEPDHPEVTVDTPEKSPLEGFNVEVKDIKISSKNIRISPFAGVGVISINMCFKHAGKKLSPAGKESLVGLLSRSLGEATKLKNRDQLEAYARKENVSISFSGLDDHFFINAKCPSGKLNELFTLLDELLFQAKFEKTDLERFKEELSADLLQSMQSPESVLNELIKSTVYKNHPYGWSNKTYVDSLKNIAEADLKKFIKDKFTQENLFVSVCGEFEEENLSEQLGKFINTLPKDFKVDLPKHIAISGPYEVNNKEFPVPQTVIKFLHTGIDHNHPDFFALQVAVGCLSDPFIGLLFKKVRVEKALTYGIGAGLAIQEHFNAFGISTFTQTGNVSKIIETVKEIITEVSKDGFPPELVKTIQKSFIGNYKRSFSSSGQIANRLTNYQLVDRRVDYHKILIEKIMVLTPEQVSEAFKKFINPDNFMIFTVGQ